MRAMNDAQREDAVRDYAYYEPQSRFAIESRHEGPPRWCLGGKTSSRRDLPDAKQQLDMPSARP